MFAPDAVKRRWKKARRLRQAAHDLRDVIYTTSRDGFIVTPDHLRFPGADDKVLGPIESAIRLIVDEAEKLEGDCA